MSQYLPTAVDIQTSGYNRYYAFVKAQPMLSADQEHELAVRCRNQQDQLAAEKLILAHLRYVVRIAKGFMGYGLPIQDLIQEGNIGLLKAVRRFDPDRKVRLASFAIHWIKAEIYKFVLNNWGMLKVATTSVQRKLFFNLRKSRASLEALREDEIKKIARDLDVPINQVREMEVRMNGSYVSYDGNPNDEESHDFAPATHLEDKRFNPERVYEQQSAAADQKEQISKALEVLNDRQKDIIIKRWLSPDKKKPSLRELAEVYKVSTERVRQIELRAMQKMRQFIEVPELITE